MKIKKVFNLALTILVTVALVLSSLVFASAAVTTYDVDTEAEWIAALQSSESEYIINVTGNFIATNPRPEVANKKITFIGKGTVTFESKDHQTGIWFSNGATAIFDGPSFVSTQAHNDDRLFVIAAETAGSKTAEVTINKGSFTNELQVQTNAKLVINGGEFFTVDDGPNNKADNIEVTHHNKFSDGTSLVINDGKFHNSRPDTGRCLNIQGGSVTVNKAEFICSNTARAVHVDAGVVGNVILSNVTAKSDSTEYLFYNCSNNTLSINNTTAVHTGASDKSNVLAAGELSGTIVLNNCNFTSAKATVSLNVPEGKIITMHVEGTENTILKSSTAEAVVYTKGAQFIDIGQKLVRYNFGSDEALGSIRFPNLFVMEYNSKDSGNYLINEFTLTPGSNYQFDIDYKVLGAIEAAIKLQYHNGTSWADLTETATSQNVAGLHKSVKFTMPADAKANGNNVRVIIGDTAFTGTGKLILSNGVLKLIKNSVSTGNNLLPNGDFATDALGNDLATVSNWNKFNNGALTMHIKALPDGYFATDVNANMFVISPQKTGSLPALSQGNITLEAGATYQIDFDIKSANEGKLADWSVNVKNAANAWSKLATTATTANVEGKHISYTFTMPADVAASDNFQIQLVTGGKVTGTIYLANFTLYKLDGNKTVGYNHISNGDLKVAKTVKLTTANLEESLIDWEVSSDLLNKANVEIFAIPNNFFEGNRTSQMLEIVHTTHGAKPNILQETVLEKDVTYRFDVDYTVTQTAEPWIRLRYAKTSGYSISFAKTETADAVPGKHISYEFTMPANAKTDGTPNFEVVLGENSTAGTGNVYFANVTLRKVENGVVVGENLLINGDFSFGEKGAVTTDNINSQLHGWTTAVSSAESVAIKEIPNEFFEALKAVIVKNSKGNITLLETVKGGKNYVFSYEYKYNGNAKATPYIEAITKNGVKKITPTSITEDLNGKYNVTVMFTMPDGLVDAKNIRIGLDFASKDIDGYFSNFALYETDKFSMPTGDNIILDSRFKTTNSIVDYSATAQESVWMKDGEFDTIPAIEIVKDDMFVIKVPNVMIVAGQNIDTYKTSKGTGAAFYQTVTVEKGKKYRLSFNQKIAQAGIEGDKVGVEVTYKKSGNVWATVDATNLPVTNEFKEVYIIDTPNDIVSSSNLQVTINIGSAWVSGYFANFSLVEIDAEGNILSNEMLVNGDFSTGDYFGWTKNSGGLNILKFNEYPENFFNKATPYKPHMLKYHSASDWLTLDQHIMLKPSTKYELIFEANHTDYVKDNMPYSLLYLGYYKLDANGNPTGTTSSDVNPESSVEELSQVTIEKSENGSVKMILETHENTRTNGDGNIWFRTYLRTGSAGFLGEMSIYEVDANGNRVGNNVLLNNDFTFGFDAWILKGSGNFQSVEKPSKDYLTNISKPAKMIQSKGTYENATYGATLTVDAYKTYYFRGEKIDMNGVGVTPEVQYRSIKENGEFVTLAADYFYSSDYYDFELKVQLPEDAIVVNGKAEIRVQINNGTRGKGYITDLMFAEEGKFTNMISNFKSSNSNYAVVPYDPEAFVFHFDDTKFDDGDWSGELGAAADEAASGAIRGKLVDSSGNPIKNATIKLSPSNIKVKTDANGEFRFDSVKEGAYTVYYIDPTGAELALYTDLGVFAGVVSVLPTAKYLRGDEIQVPIVDDNTQVTPDAEPYGALRGYLFDENGNPVANARIYIRGNGYAVTNEKGVFEFAELPVGEYDVYEMLVDGSEVVYRTVKIEAYKGTVIKIAREGEGFNWLFVIIPAIAVVVLASGTMAAILIFKKKK
ncbi:MAG: carboxypeptidase regulatory-like domain-containing protein [Clostridia bacterium]|nr:carboxypeptidase regulatory-like domain-containing protein [Clostridia bacterium]